MVLPTPAGSRRTLIIASVNPGGREFAKWFPQFIAVTRKKNARRKN